MADTVRWLFPSWRDFTAALRDIAESVRMLAHQPQTISSAIGAGILPGQLARPRFEYKADFGKRAQAKS